jgi:hypothetical protein
VVSEGAEAHEWWSLAQETPTETAGQIWLVFYEIYRVGDRARSPMNFARKGLLVCVCYEVILTGYFCSGFANSEFVRWKSLISGMR